MKSFIIKIEKFYLVTLFLLISFSCATFADTIEMRNGMKTTYAEKPISMIDTIDKNYSFKWALDKKGNWKLYIRSINGKLLYLSNVWVNLYRDAINSDGNKVGVIDYYYFDINGNLVTGWYVAPNKDTYFLQTSDTELGRMARGWQKIGDDYYYFNMNGVLLKDTVTPDGFHVNAEGKWR